MGLFPPLRFCALANLDEYGVFKEAAARLSATWPLPFRTLGASLCYMLTKRVLGCALAFGRDRGEGGLLFFRQRPNCFKAGKTLSTWL